MARFPWEDDFPDVVVHCRWAAYRDEGSCLSKHPNYEQAKKQRDVHSALTVINDLAREGAIDELRAIAIAKGVTPIVVGPAAQVGESQNALALTYAEWLAKEMDWPVEDRVFQTKAVSRDKQNWLFRLAHPAEFYGQIDTTTPYVIVDDVVTQGGTLADLRSFILGKGGSVIAMSAIASREGTNRQIRIGHETITQLESHYGSDFAQFCSQNLGFGHDCLTHDEGGRLLGCPGYVELGKGLQRARDQGNSSRGAKPAR